MIIHQKKYEAEVMDHEKSNSSQSVNEIPSPV